MRENKPFKEKLMILLLPVALLASFLIIVNSGGSDSKDKPTLPVGDPGDGVKTVAISSITSIKAQSNLVVLDTNIYAIATSGKTSMGMTANQTDIKTENVQYFVKMDTLSEKNVTITPDTLTVTLPTDAIVSKSYPGDVHDTYNNNSWLFTVNSDTTKQLTAANTDTINLKFSEQILSLQGQAIINAKAALTPLFEIPLRVAGYKHKVVIEFKNPDPTPPQVSE